MIDPVLALIFLFTVSVIAVVVVGGVLNFQSVRRGDGTSHRGMAIQYGASALMLLIAGVVGIVAALLSGMVWGLLAVVPMLVVGSLLAINALRPR